MTTITRINSTYSSGGGAHQHGYGNGQRQKPNHLSIWGDAPSSNNFNFPGGINSRILNQIGNLSRSYINNVDPMSGPSVMPGADFAPIGASFVPMDQIMTAPFGANADLLGSDQFGSNPFTSDNSIFSNGRDNGPHRRNRNGRGFNNDFLSLTGDHDSNLRYSRTRTTNGNNIFKNTTVNANQFNKLKLTNTTVKTGNFGSQTINGHSTNIHTPSGNFNFKDVDSKNLHSSKTTLSGRINSYQQTKQHINTATSNLDRTRQVIDTPTERITRTRTKGTIWV